MILTPHILIGAAIGAKIGNFYLVVLFSLAAHYLTEIIPHQEYDINSLKKRMININKNFLIDLTKVLFDFLVGASLALYLSFNQPYLNYVIVGILSATLPDFLLFLYWQYDSKILSVLKQFHQAPHFKNKNTLFWQGILTQVIISLVAILILTS